MAISPVCDRCVEELNEPGGVAFDPPDAFGRTSKLHLCQSCWEDFLSWIITTRREAPDADVMPRSVGGPPLLDGVNVAPFVLREAPDAE